MLPSAFEYRYAAQDGDLVRLDYSPNPAFKTPNREAEVFHHMQGSVWIDPSKKRIGKIEGRLTSEVKFGGGILGHLDPGGTFRFEQRDVGNGHWEMTNL